MLVSERDQLNPVGERFLLYTAPLRAAIASFADDVRTGLGAPSKFLSPKYFYDELGSALFEAITFLPEYYLTRAETDILERYAGEIFDALGEPVEIVEFGSGSARKTRLLIAEACRRQERVEYKPIDISPTALIDSAAGLVAEYERLHVSAYACDYFETLASGRVRTSQRVLALFLGSNVGNYQPADAERLLRAMSSSFKRGDALLLGTDLKKAAATLEVAYNDPTGVTAAFDKNLLGRINRELSGNFDLDAFEHVARYDREAGVVNSYLMARRGQTVRIGDLEMDVKFATNETIHTEASYKFDAFDVMRLAARAGYRVSRRWLDSESRYAVSLLIAE
ncbi:MAG: L-histidine N(alpha)-methyltransferase [Candidatus Eremiobacteraeota bacterium]|nr:L-histidine N(alpha)-methyltransferase [Candidatus Eremiobacteraeota bacterium]